MLSNLGGSISRSVPRVGTRLAPSVSSQAPHLFAKVENFYTGFHPMQMTSPQMFVQSRAYHEAVIDHFANPRNVGKLDAKKSNVGTALVGKASCGDVIKLQIEVEEGKIKDAKFKTFGCGSAIASSSLATEMIIGREVEFADKIKNTDISQELKLPPVKIHCSVLAEEAIQEALKNYREKQTVKEPAKE